MVTGTLPARVGLGDVAEERRQLAHQLDADQAGADDADRQQPAALGVVGLGVGVLEQVDHVVAQEDRVGQCLERQRVLGAGDDLQFGHPAEGQDQVVVGELPRLGAAREWRAVTTRASKSTDSTSASTNRAGRRSIRRIGETACRGSSTPEPASKRNGVMRK